jgi:isocitrate dehydrogenase (NAD+)
MQLALDPTPFDVVLLENLYGDIVSDLASGLVGGLGLVPGANIGTAAAVFEAVHGSAPDIAGKDLANPVALILSAALMLRHLGEGDAADRVARAVLGVLQEGRVRTRDLGGAAGTRAIRDAIVARVRGGAS